jgi:hypothetical protein
VLQTSFCLSEPWQRAKPTAEIVCSLASCMAAYVMYTWMYAYVALHAWMHNICLPIINF